MSNNNDGAPSATPSREPSPNPRNRNNPRRNNNQGVPSNPIGYEGECDKIGAVLALKTERFHKKVTYEVFIEKICNYVIKKYSNGADVKPLIMEGKDPIEIYERKHMPAPLPSDKKDDPILEAIMREEIKQYVVRKNNIRRNIQSTFGLIWGQCSSALQAYVKGQEGYLPASNDYDLKWLLREIRKASSGIDEKSNAYTTMHESIGALYRMRQGANESNDGFVERFKNAVMTVDMVQGGHLFFSPGITKREKTEATEQEIYSAKEASMAALLLQNSDQGRYGDLISRLKEGANL